MLSVAQVDALTDTVDRRWRALMLLAAHGAGSASASWRRSPAGICPKSQAGIRSVAIPPHLVDDLREHLASFAEPERTALVFVGPKGAPLDNSNFNRVV